MHRTHALHATQGGAGWAQAGQAALPRLCARSPHSLTEKTKRKRKTLTAKWGGGGGGRVKEGGARRLRSWIHL
eukprot:3933881-Rhodomonas_salina.2